MSDDQDKQVLMTTRRVSIVDSQEEYDELVKKERPPVSNTTRRIRLAVGMVCSFIIGTLALTALIHFECTNFGRFKVLDQVYECKWVGAGGLK